MTLQIIRNDITQMNVDAIVNAANNHPLIGFGVDSGIHQKAGEKLLEARKKFGTLPFGKAIITPAFNLNAKYVIHAISPLWLGGEHNELIQLKNCYENALDLAIKHKCKSVAFPLLSAGNQGFPKDLALQTAINVFSQVLLKKEIQIYLVVFDSSVYALSEKLFNSVQSYVDDKYIEAKLNEEYHFTGHSIFDERELYNARQKRNIKNHQLLKEYNPSYYDATIQQSTCEPTKEPDSKSCSLKDLMNNMDCTFSENLIQTIDKKHLKDPTVYKRANIDRKLFSKIKNNINYKPSKQTAIAFAIALELNLDETKDFIGKAGYALSHSNKFDIIIEYFIENKNYNIFEINEVLFAFEQPLIGV